MTGFLAGAVTVGRVGTLGTEPVISQGGIWITSPTMIMFGFGRWFQ